MRKFAVLAAVLVACGGSKDDAPKSDPRPAEPPKPPPAEPGKPTPAPPPVPVANDLGSCSVAVTGAATASITSRGGVSRVASSYWFAEDDKANIMFPRGQVGLVINCDDENGGLSITSGPKVTKDSLPFGPKKYTLQRGLAGGELHAIGHVGKTSLMSPVGTVDITAYDGKHIAGTFELTATVVPGKGFASLTGKFDYLCSQYSGCAK